MEDNKRDFKGVWISKDVWLDERLNALEKVILAEIDSLDQGEHGCFASNNYIAEFCQCSETKVSTSISKLIEYGYLYVKKFDGRQRELKSRLSNFERQALNFRKADSQNLKHNNIDINTVNNTDIKDKESIKEIINYLNERAGTNYKPTTPKTISAIKARLNEGFTVEDFKIVIDKKCSEWFGTEQERYLRPETLFGTKFEGYLNQRIVQKVEEHLF